MAKEKNTKPSKTKPVKASKKTVSNEKDTKKEKINNVQQTYEKKVENNINNSVAENAENTPDFSNDSITPIEENKVANTVVDVVETLKSQQAAAKEEVSIAPEIEIEEVKVETTATTTETAATTTDVTTDTTNAPAYDTRKEFSLRKGTQFLQGHFIIQIDNTKIKRVNDIDYKLFGVTDASIPFDAPFECNDKFEADFLWNQLLEYEKTPEKFIVSTEPPKQVEPIVEPPKIEPVEEKKNPAEFAGIPLSRTNIDDLIKALPDDGGGAVTNHNPVQTLATPSDISSIINNQSNAQLEAYAESIASYINTSFQANVWGAMPRGDVQTFLSNQSKEYKYEIKNDGEKGIYLEVSKDNTVVRMPKNTAEYMKIS
jgi:hypothetical protein